MAARASSAQRARVLLLGAFALSGVLFFSWLARVPSVRDALGLSTPELGAVLLIGSLGSLAVVFTCGTLLNRYGSKKVFAVGTGINAIGFLLMGVGPSLGSVVIFAAGLIISGAGGAMLNVAMNLESTRIEQALGHSVIPHFHAAFSAGAVAGSLLGAGASSFGVPVVVQFAIVTAATAGLRWGALWGGMFIPGPARRPTLGEAARHRLRAELRVWTEPRTLLIGVIAFSAALSEGAANNWLTVAFVDGFDQSEATAGLVLGVFIAAMTLVRTFGTTVIDRLGRTHSLQLSGMSAVIGLILFGVAADARLAVVGAALWGIGAALCFPIAVAAASQDPTMAASRVSVVSSMGTVASLVVSPALGFIVGILGAQHALLVVLVAFVASIAVAGIADPPADTVADPVDVLSG